jgi:hypothetical protein
MSYNQLELEKIAALEKRVADLEQENSKLKAAWQQSDGARKGWLNEFDGYKLQILTLTQRLSEARTLIERIGTVAVGNGNIIRSAEIWLKKTP